MLSKSEVKSIVKKNGYTMIAPSWYTGKDVTNGVCFKMYDEYGDCYDCYYTEEYNCLSRCFDVIILVQSLSPYVIHDTRKYKVINDIMFVQK